MYAFNGFASLLTYLHDYAGWNTAGYFQYFVLVLAAALISVIILTYRRRVHYLRAAMVGILVFIAFFYRINYQYLIIFIPLALLITTLTTYQSERVLALVLALFPAGWLWMFDVSFWFNYLDPKTPGVVPVFRSFGLTQLGLPDSAYVVFALVLTGLCLAYIVLTFTHWREPLAVPAPGETFPEGEPDRSMKLRQDS